MWTLMNFTTLLGLSVLEFHMKIIVVEKYFNNTEYTKR